MYCPDQAVFGLELRSCNLKSHDPEITQIATNFATVLNSDQLLTDNMASSRQVFLVLLLIGCTHGQQQGKGSAGPSSHLC